MSLIRIHCTQLNLEIPFTLPAEIEQAYPFTILRSASLATVLLAVERPQEDVYLSIQDGGATTYYHTLHTVDTAQMHPPRLQNDRAGASPEAGSRPYLAALPFLTLVDSHLLYTALQALVAEVFHQDLTIGENCDAISDTADRASRALQLFARVQDQREGRTVEVVLALLERDLQGCTATRERAARIGVPLPDPPAPGDVLAWLLCEAKRVEEQAKLPDGGSLAEPMAYATRLRGFQSCLACLGVEHTALLFRLRDAEVRERDSGQPSSAGGQAQ